MYRRRALHVAPDMLVSRRLLKGGTSCSRAVFSELFTVIFSFGNNPDMMHVEWLYCATQFNCFFLMPVVDTFPSLLREDLETAFEQDIDHVFDVAQVRRSLYQQKVDLELELRRVC